MAEPELITTRDFTSSRYAQLADTIEGDLGDIIARAEAKIQSVLGYQIKVRTYTETWRARTNTLFVLNRPIVSVTSVKRRFSFRSGWETLDLSTLYVEKDAGYIESQWSQVAGYDVEVVYTAGFTTVPEDIKEAVIMQTVLLSSQDLEVYGSGDGRAPGILYMQKDVDNLLEPFKRTATVYH